MVDLLNDLYTMFDDLIGKFDCYKVSNLHVQINFILYYEHLSKANER